MIIGGGAVGSHLAASLRRATPLLIIDRDERVRAAFNARGIETARLEDIQLSHDSESQTFRSGDIAILTTSASAAAGAARLLPAWMPMICLCNGVIQELESIRNGSLSTGVVEFAVSSPAPGMASRTRAGWLTLQRNSPGDATSWLAASLVPRLQRTRLTNDINAHRRGKLMLNASLDPVAAVIGGTLGDVFRHRTSFRAFRALLAEALAVARASGWRLHAVQGARPEVMAAVFSIPIVRAVAGRVAASQAAGVASTLAREIARGEMGEVDHLCGAIARQGEVVGVQTPAHRRAMEVLQRIAAEPGGRGGRPELAHELLQR